MCQFFSAIVNRNGDVLWSEVTDSHEHLIEANGLRDDPIGSRGFARVEFTPPSDHAKIRDMASWRFRVDEERTPEWLDVDAQSAARAKMERIITAAIERGSSGRLLLGGLAIAIDAKVSVRSGRVDAYGSSTVEACGSSTVVARGSSEVEAWDSSTVVAYDSSTVMARGSSTVVAWNSSKVEAYGSSTVVARGSSTVEDHRIK